MNDLCDTRNTMAVGAGKRLHDRRIYSSPARSGNCRGIDQSNFWTWISITTPYRERQRGHEKSKIDRNNIALVTCNNGATG